LDKECPNAYTWNVIEETENRLIYEIQRIHECVQWPYKQDEIGLV
jgi:hypothetical protein